MKTPPKLPRLRRICILVDSDLIEQLTEIAKQRAETEGFPVYETWLESNRAAVDERASTYKKRGVKPPRNLAVLMYRAARGPGRVGRPSFHEHLYDIYHEGMSSWLASNSEGSKRGNTKKKDVNIG